MEGLQFRVSEGEPLPQPQTVVPPAQAAPLSQSEIQRVLDRFPPLPAEEKDIQEFALPAETLPPPRPGKTISEPFPPQASEEAPDKAAAGPLEVLRRSPEGEVPLAPTFSLTFSQPMIALTSHEGLAGQSVPVRLTPEPPGAWRWVGTRTLLFEPRGRFPMATDYRVEVPAGASSALGSRLAEAVRWSFSTPPPRVQSSYPTGGPHRKDSLIFVAFDQRIEPQKVLETVKVTTGGRAYPVRLASPEEIEANQIVRGVTESAQKGQWLAFRSVEPFPAGAEVAVTVGPGTPSAEGPRRTAEAQQFAFRTFGRLDVEEHGCRWGRDCPPLTPWYIQFSNPLDAAAFEPSLIQVEPELPDLNLHTEGRILIIQGRSQGRTAYKVKLKSAIRDVFGQTLGQDRTLSFKVGSAGPRISVPAGDFVVLDPSGPPTFSVFTVNYQQLKVRIYAARPEDWPMFQTFMRQRTRDRSRQNPPGRLILENTIQIRAEADRMAETPIDFAPALKNGLGQLIVEIEATLGRVKSLFRSDQEPVLYSWVQATHLGLDAFADGEELIVWANSLADGIPLEGVHVNLFPNGASSVTGPDGLARLPLPPQSEPGAPLLAARRGQDVAILREGGNWWGQGGWRRSDVQDMLRWFVFDDRTMYRPGEEVHVKGWIRRVGGGKDGDVGPLEEAAKRVQYRLADSRGNHLLNGELALNALGGFDAAFTLPDRMNLGHATLSLAAVEGNLAGRQYQHTFQVQEFRRPEFEVSASASEGPHLVGGHAQVWVKASYYAGGALPNAEVTWEISSSPGHFRPPGWDKFTFGAWTPWWQYHVEPRGQGRTLTSKGRTDASGTHWLRIDFEAAAPPRATSVTAQATVMDVNRQAWSARKHLLVHPSENYVGLRCESIFIQPGQPLRIEAIVTDLDGNPVAGRTITMQAIRLDWTYKGGLWREEEILVHTCTVTSAREPVACTFELPKGGTYRIAADVEDSSGRKNQSEITRWVSGGQRPPHRGIEQEEVILIPNRQEYQPGDTAEILVQPPFWPAEGLVTLRRSGIVATERIRLDGPSHTLKIPIKEAYMPNVHVQVDLVGSAPRTDDAGRVMEQLPKRPAFAMGTLNLRIPPLARRLSLEVTPREKKVEPGMETTVDIVLRDAAGRAVEGGEVALVVVDEAVLSLTNYHLADPLSIFYHDRSPEVSDYHLRKDIILVSPDRLMAELTQRDMPLRAEMPAPPSAAMPSMAAERARGGGPEPIRMRMDFNALAAFIPVIITDAHGRAEVRIKLPDNLTRYRVMAAAVADGKRFGLGESNITARLPLMVRPSPPRFLNFGDRFELPVAVQNQTDEPLVVDVALRTSNMELTAGAGRRVAVPANDRVEVRFPASSVSSGTARFQVGAVSGRWADAAQIQVPVWTPATTEAVAVYGEIDEGSALQPIMAPGNVFTQFGGLEITTSSTALHALTDAVLYLMSYPFECSEQIASRVLSVAALKDVLSAFEAQGLPAPEEMVAAVQRDIDRLRGLQNGDGGFPVWQRGNESWPYHSIHVAHALARARAKGFVVPQEMLSQSQEYLRAIEKHIPVRYSDPVRTTLIAYALSVRALLGDVDVEGARRLISQGSLEKLSPEAVGWLLSVLSGAPGAASEIAAIRRYVGNRVTETAGTAHFVTSYGDQEYLLLHSNRRTDGIILESLIKDQPKSDLIPKLVRGLMAHRKKGRWNNTQENVFILLALDRYFKTYEAATPDFAARVWLGERFAGQAQFKGRTAEYHHIAVPMSFLAEKKQQDVVVSKDGPGRLYYRLGLRYASRDLRSEPADHGFTVERAYEAVDNPDDVIRDTDGTWRVKAGARVRVRLRMVAETRRYHVALMDPLPAGFEALNPALAVTESVPRKNAEAEPRFFWWGPWYEHQNLRDDRAEAFASLLWDGVYTYIYVARATTPGRFVVPPAKAEEMYAPETFGRSSGDVVIIK